MSKIVLALFFLINSAVADHYTFSLDLIPEEDYWGPDFIPDGETGYHLDLTVPWGLIGLILSYDDSSPSPISISASATGLAQGYKFYAVDSPNSANRIQIASNDGEYELNLDFTLASGHSQILSFESDIKGETGWVEIEYHATDGLRIISQYEPPAQEEPTISFHNGSVRITPLTTYGIIQESTDLKNWENIGTHGNGATLSLADNPGPLYFRELCP